MKKALIIIGFIAAVIATILASTKLYMFSIIPIITAFICGVALIFISKKTQNYTKSIQYIFLLVIMSLGLTIYKNVTIVHETQETEQTESTETENQNKSETPQPQKLESKIRV
ncbi:hypothetical protein [Winogradskyella endarachnes]|uniref:FUSC family protein n=1 Tax=Winogradskyella endarachnes TaxID=2681965 RepID=A0A6L6U8P4_9FLAO|nr:hypothetical protein [Winogradskyella endarachnes]MUU78399.1 hypothetical protein [Winogradskyella endarachnes]